MRVAIAYNEPLPGADASDLDVLVQRDAVAAALLANGHVVVDLPCTLDLSTLTLRLKRERVDVVFNLVESLAGTDRLQVLVPMLLTGLQMPYTGTRARAMLETSDKLAVKRRLRALNLPTADWIEGDQTGQGRFIVKARYEHASVGMDDGAVVDAGQLVREVPHRSLIVGAEMFAEQFIDGREFNISVIAAENGEGQVLSPAEIDFSGLPRGKPHIVGYDAKWNESSLEFNTTPRVFDFPKADAALLTKLTRLSKTVWKAFDLTGYVRIDYRVDAEGNPFVLEINSNPCLSPDAGFAAAVTTSGHSFAWAIDRILSNASLNLP